MYSPNWEAIKQVARLCTFAAISFVLTVILDQIKLIPEVVNLKVWVITFPIPLQNIFFFICTIGLTYTDKFKFVSSKLDPKKDTAGLLPF